MPELGFCLTSSEGKGEIRPDPASAVVGTKFDRRRALARSLVDADGLSQGVQPRFNDLMRNHFQESEEVLNSPERMSTYPNRVLGWIRQDPVLSHACQNDDLS